MIYVKNFNCAPNRIKKNSVTTLLLKFEAQNKNNQAKRPVEITYNIPADNGIVWESSSAGQIDNSGKNLVVREAFGKNLNGFKHNAKIAADESADGIILDMITVDMTDNDDDLDSTTVLVL